VDDQRGGAIASDGQRTPEEIQIWGLRLDLDRVCSGLHIDIERTLQRFDVEVIAAISRVERCREGGGAVGESNVIAPIASVDRQERQGAVIVNVCGSEARHLAAGYADEARRSVERIIDDQRIMRDRNGGANALHSSQKGVVRIVTDMHFAKAAEGGDGR